MPTPTLPEFIRQAMALADYRNLATENPVPVQVPLGNGENMIVVVAHMEPNNVTLPFNVSWIVADPASDDFKKVLRRVSALPTVNYRNTWQEVTTYDDLIDEPQFWDFTSGFNLGEVDVPQLGAATVDVRGLMKLNRAYTPDAARPVVVTGNDPRMSDKRNPLPHTHPKLPITIMRGATGINGYTVRVDTSDTPKPGEILTVTGKGAREGEWIGAWRRPVQADLVYDGPTFDDLVIVGPDGPIDETMPFTFRANAVFSDGQTVNNVSASWAVIGNGEFASISQSTGIFQSLDIDEDQTIRVEARYTHPESGKTITKFVDVQVRDTTVKVNLVRIELNGMTELEENSLTTYTVTAFFDNDTSTGVTPSTFTSSNPGAGTFNAASGVLEVGELTADQTTTISATYSFNGITRDATMEVICRDVTIYPQSAAIIGLPEVGEATTVNYVLRVTYTNGIQTDVPASDWASSNEAAGSINATTGEFTATSGLREDVSTTLSASYTLEGRTVNANRQILVKDLTVYPKSAVILGSPAINENTVSTYQFSVTHTDDTVAVVSVSNWALDNPAIGVINPSTGQLVAAENVTLDTTGVISASYTSEGVTVEAQFTITVRDITNYPISARVVGSAQMDENTTQTLTFEVTYLDNTKVNEPVTNWASSNPSVASVGAANGLVTSAVNVSTNGTTTISASFSKFGRTVTADLALTVRDVTNYPVSAVVNGPATINESSQGDYTLAVTFSDGTTANRSATWSVTGGGGATVNSTGRVTAPVNVDANTAGEVTGSFTLDGRTVSAKRSFQIIDTTVYPVSARIVGPNSVPENTSQAYTLEVTFSDATKQTVTVTNWASSVITTGTIGANTGLFNALETTGNKITKLTASYTSAGRTVGSEIDVTVVDATNYPVSAAVEGPASMDEGSSDEYVLRVTFTDGTTALVPVTNWASSQTSVGVINPTSGAFTAAANLTTTSTTVVSGSYTSEGITVSAERTVTVRDVTVYPVSAIINGPAVVDSLGTQQYEMRVTFEDASTVVMQADSWTSSNAGTAGTIDANGLFTAKENKTGSNINTTLTAVYSLDGRSVTATRAIGVRDTTNYPSTVTILGVNSVSSSTASGPGTADFNAEVTYLDGTKNNAPSGTWTVTGASQSDNVGTINADGLFTANQKPGGANRNITIAFQYTEHGRTINGTKSVALTVVPVPASLTVNGDATIASNGTKTYTARVTLTDGSQQNVTAAWTTNAAPDVATINAATGVLTAGRVEADTGLTVSAEYTANGLTVNATRSVTVLKVVELSSISVTGPTTVEEGQTAQYAVTANFNNGTTAPVTGQAVYSSSVGAAGSFSGTTAGLFNAAAVDADTATVLTFSYTSGGITQTATINLTVTAQVATGTAMPRYGVAQFSDTDFTGGKTGTDDYGNPYERWTGIQDFADSVLTTEMPSTEENQTITYNIGDGQYGYFMHPKAMMTEASPTARFTDIAINVPGGMGGITWTPPGEIGESFEPMEVMYDANDGQGAQPWLIYRTDWDSLGTITFKVEFKPYG